MNTVLAVVQACIPHVAGEFQSPVSAIVQATKASMLRVNGLTLLRRAMDKVIELTSLRLEPTHAYESLEDIKIQLANHSAVRYGPNIRAPPCVFTPQGGKLQAEALWSLNRVRSAGALGDLPAAWALISCYQDQNGITIDEWDAVYCELDAAYTVQYQMLVPMLYRLVTPVTELTTSLHAEMALSGPHEWLGSFTHVQTIHGRVGRNETTMIALSAMKLLRADMSVVLHSLHWGSSPNLTSDDKSKFRFLILKDSDAGYLLRDLTRLYVQVKTCVLQHAVLVH